MQNERLFFESTAYSKSSHKLTFQINRLHNESSVVVITRRILFVFSFPFDARYFFRVYTRCIVFALEYINIPLFPSSVNPFISYMYKECVQIKHKDRLVVWAGNKWDVSTLSINKKLTSSVITYIYICGQGKHKNTDTEPHLHWKK